MNTMEITKFVAGFCGSLLVFLLIQMAAHGIYATHSEEVAYSVAVEDTGAGEGEEAEEEVDVVALLGGADAAAGESVFRRCASCHKLDGSNGVGPHLDGVFERDIASVEGFAYSDALAGLEGNWDPDDLYHFVENPKEYVPGTKMSFAGLSDPEDLVDLIAYLQSVSP
jgi:cytochrome c